MSTASIATSSAGTRRLRSATASAIAIAPLPVPTSTIRNGAAAYTPGPDRELCHHLGEHQVDDMLGLRARDERAPIDGQGDPVELLDAADVGDRLPGGAPLERRADTSPRRPVPTGASPFATTVVRSTPMACASNSSASSRGVSNPSARRRSTPSSTSAFVVVIALDRSESDRDGHVSDLAQDLRTGGAAPAVEEQIDRGVAHLQVR